MDDEGSTAVTWRPGGSYAPAPLPTFTSVREPPSAVSITAAIDGSGVRYSV